MADREEVIVPDGRKRCKWRWVHSRISCLNQDFQTACPKEQGAFQAPRDAGYEENRGVGKGEDHAQEVPHNAGLNATCRLDDVDPRDLLSTSSCQNHRPTT